MRRVMGGLEHAIISPLKPIIVTPAHRGLESFARYILETATAHPVQARPAQRFAVTAAVTDAQPAVLPQPPLRTEALGRMDVGAEATSTDGAHPGRSAKQLDLGKGLGRPEHQQSRLGLRRHTLIQHGVKWSNGGAQVG